MPIERKTGSALHQTIDFGTAEVLGQLCQFQQVHVVVHNAVCTHFRGMNVQNLEPALFIWERNLHMHLQTTWTQESLVYHVESIGHADDEDIIELVYTVHLYKQDEQKPDDEFRNEPCREVG